MLGGIYDISAKGTGVLDTGTFGSVVDFTAMADAFWVQYNVKAGACWLIGWHAKAAVFGGSSPTNDIILYIADVATVGIGSGDQSNITDNDVWFFYIDDIDDNRKITFDPPIKIDNGLWVGMDLTHASSRMYVSVYWGT